MSLILYVEDDALLQLDGQIMLEAAGHEVILAADGLEGCEALRRHGPRLDVLLTDVQLGGAVDGWELAEFGRAINEELPVLYMTGSEGGEFSARSVAQAVIFLKPFAWPEVLRSVSGLLH